MKFRIEDRGPARARRRWLSALAGLLALFLPALALAQAPPDPNDPRQQEIDAIYEQLLDDPTDADLNRRLAELALELGDVDAAIGAIERLVFLDPENVALQLEVARLYLRIDSYAAARGYLADAERLPGATPAQRAEIEQLVAEVEDATKPPVFAGLAQVGLRYQTNANVGPAQLGEFETGVFEDPIADFNAFVLGTLAYANRVSDNLIIEGSLSGYYAEQFKVDRLDLGFAELQAGPRLLWHDDRVSVKPYALTQGIMLGADPYLFTYGAGAVASLMVTDSLRLEPEFEYKNRTFYASDDYSTAPTQNGDLFSYTIRGTARLSDRATASARVSYNRNLAAEDYQSHDQVIANLAMTFGFDVLDSTDWEFTPFARLIWTDYKGLAPNEVENALDTIRSDFQWNLGGTLVAPVTAFTSLSAQLMYTSNDSTLSRFTYENLQVTIGPVGRF